VTTAMTVFFNTILIPFFIDVMVLIEDHPSKSRRQLAILNRNFFFMVLNSFLIPLTSTTTIKSVLVAIA
jgi:Calcium-dependent channel, 7TM region, putative phosphate